MRALRAQPGRGNEGRAEAAWQGARELGIAEDPADGALGVSDMDAGAITCHVVMLASVLTLTRTCTETDQI